MPPYTPPQSVLCPHCGRDLPTVVWLRRFAAWSQYLLAKGCLCQFPSLVLRGLLAEDGDALSRWRAVRAQAFRKAGLQEWAIDYALSCVYFPLPPDTIEDIRTILAFRLVMEDVAGCQSRLEEAA